MRLQDKTYLFTLKQALAFSTSVQKPRLSTILKGALALGALGYLIYLVEPDRILETARQAQPWWIVLAALLLPMNLSVEIIIWRRLARSVVPDLSLKQAAASLLCGYPLGAFTPARLGELAGRAFYIDYPDKWELGTVVFAQRMLDMIIAINAGLLALLYFIRRLQPEPALFWWALAVFGAGMALTLTTLGLFPSLAYRAVCRITSRAKIHRRAAFLQRYPPLFMANMMGLTLLRYLIYCTQYVLLLHAFIPSLDYFDAYLGGALVFYAKFLIPSLTFMDIGIREGAAIFFFGRLGIAEAAAFNSSFLLFCLNLLLPALIGIPFVLRLRLTNNKSPGAGPPPVEPTPTEKSPHAPLS